MPRKIMFTKEQIIDAAFAIVDNEGFEHLSARKLASALNSSVAPIYVNFIDFDELKKKVIEKINRVALELAVQSQSGNPLKDIGAASIRFAFQHPKLFQDYIFGKFEFDENDEVNAYVRRSIKEDRELSLFSEKEISEYLEKIRIYQIGLCIMASNKSSNAYSESDLIQMLNDMSLDIIYSIKHR
ncbi:MAG: TetR/AcrR family transcriptional regulator [Erysipelotrichaceae bacterium]|nr:TetR/AcrR family transcriptional regulator [Erysipelotrichaceae bacterium]